MIDLNYFFFFFNDTATTEIYTLSLHDALPIWLSMSQIGSFALLLALVLSAYSFVAGLVAVTRKGPGAERLGETARRAGIRSEEHTSELQSPCNLVCRLLLEKKKKQ